MTNGLVAGLIGLVVGVGAGIIIGAVLIADDDPAPAPVAGSERSVTPTVSPTPIPSPLPTESAEFEPCTRPGLCEFLTLLDQRLLSENLDGIMEMIAYEPMQCGTPETELFDGIFPVECRDWPYPEAIPTAGFAERDAAGHPLSRWALREVLDGFIAGIESDCAGTREGIERRVRVVVSPPNPTLYWSGEIALLVGPPLDCFPAFEPESGQRYAFNLRSNGAGEWKIESIVEVAYDECEEAYYVYVGELRYYPLEDGVPSITGVPPVCER